MFKEAYWTQTHYLALSRLKGQNCVQLYFNEFVFPGKKSDVASEVRAPQLNGMTYIYIYTYITLTNMILITYTNTYMYYSNITFTLLLTTI